MTAMYLLALDTATEVCAAALVADGRTVAQTVFVHGSTHARRLMAAVDWILECAGVSIERIDLLAVTSGPGSFTGLRIGLSTAKGLAAALNKPLMGISSLEVLAHQSPADGRLVCPLIDARRGEAYWALYERKGDGLACLIEPRVDPPSRIAARITQDCTLIGNGARVYGELIIQQGHAGIRRLVDHLNDLNPAVLARLGYLKWCGGQLESEMTLSPSYIRSSDAQPLHGGRIRN